MSDEISFRPTEEDLEIIEVTRHRYGLTSRAEAIRHLIREAFQAQHPVAGDPVFRFRVPPEARNGEDLTSRNVDEGLYR